MTESKMKPKSSVKVTDDLFDIPQCNERIVKPKSCEFNISEHGTTRTCIFDTSRREQTRKLDQKISKRILL